MLSDPPPDAHFLQLYEEPATNVEMRALFALEGLKRREKVVLVGSRDDLGNLSRRLDAQGPATGWWLQRRGDLTFMETGARREQVLAGDMPDAAAFQETLRGFIKGIPERYRGLRFWGNVTGKLFAEGSFQANLALEQLWQGAWAAGPLVVLCSYPGKDMRPETHAAPLGGIFGNHTHFIPPGKAELAFELQPSLHIPGKVR